MLERQGMMNSMGFTNKIGQESHQVERPVGRAHARKYPHTHNSNGNIALAQSNIECTRAPPVFEEMDMSKEYTSRRTQC